MTNDQPDPEIDALLPRLHRGRRIGRAATMTIITALVLLVGGGGTALAVAELSDRDGFGEGY